MRKSEKSDSISEMPLAKDHRVAQYKSASANSLLPYRVG